MMKGIYSRINEQLGIDKRATRLSSQREKESKRDRDRKNRTSYVYLPVNTVRNTFSGIGIANVLTTHNECTC